MYSQHHVVLVGSHVDVSATIMADVHGLARAVVTVLLARDHVAILTSWEASLWEKRAY